MADKCTCSVDSNKCTSIILIFAALFVSIIFSCILFLTAGDIIKDDAIRTDQIVIINTTKLNDLYNIVYYNHVNLIKSSIINSVDSHLIYPHSIQIICYNTRRSCINVDSTCRCGNISILIYKYLLSFIMFIVTALVMYMTLTNGETESKICVM